MKEYQALYLKTYLNTKQILSLEDKNLNNNALFMLNLKSPKMALILGIFLGSFGVDRFYKGNILLGIIRLLGGVISYFLFIAFQGLAMLFGRGVESNENADLIVLSCLVLWVLINFFIYFDVFLVYRGIKNDNFQKILSVIKDEN